MAQRRVTRRGPSVEPFGWEICREKDCLAVNRSTKTFPTRIEAVLDSVRTAVSLALVLIVDTAQANLD